MSMERVFDDGFEYPTWTSFFGSLLRAAREERGLSVEQAAQRAAMHPVRWQGIEDGEEATGAEMPLLARGLGITNKAGMAPLIFLCRGVCG